MPTLDSQALQERKAQLETAMQEARDEFQRLAGAIQLCDALIAELEDAHDESEDNDHGN
jgi:hypothetical protein